MAPDFCTSEWQPMSWFTPAAKTTSAKPALHAITDALTSAKCDASNPARTRLVARFYGRRHRRPGVLARLQTTAGTLTHLTVELRRGHRLIAKTSVARRQDAASHRRGSGTHSRADGRSLGRSRSARERSARHGRPRAADLERMLAKATGPGRCLPRGRVCVVAPREMPRLAEK